MPSERKPREARKWTDGPPPTILVVDDAEDTRLLYASYLSYAGLTVQEAGDGEEALAVVAKSPPDLVVMDLAMPHLDGWESTRRIKANPQTKDVCVIVVTSNAMPDQLAKAHAAGADAVLTKPCLPEVLFESVCDVLRRRRR